jgi:hypothetical protein
LPDLTLPGRVLVDTARPDVAELSLEDYSFGVAAHSAVLVHSVFDGPSR